MKHWRLFVLLLAATAYAAPAADGLSAEQEQRYQDLTRQLRCLVCQNQSIAESTAPLAGDLRDQVQAQIQQGRSDQEIVDYLTARYGDFVLYRPRFKASTALLWLAPALLAAAGLVGAVRASLKQRRVRAPAVDSKALNRLLDESDRTAP